MYTKTDIMTTTKTHSRFGQVTITNETETHVTFIIEETEEEKTLIKRFVVFEEDKVEEENVIEIEEETKDVISNAECQNYFENQREIQRNLYSRKF